MSAKEIGMLWRITSIVLGIALILLAVFSFLYSGILQGELNQSKKCYQEYRAVDSKIEDCVRAANFTIDQCLSYWPEKTALLKVGCEP